jgi:threonine/homoserine/homoserine lactone efflux protein
MDNAMILRQGFVIGFVVSILSYGPLFMIFARETLAHGRIVGLFSGLGIATADAISAAVAVVGLSLVTDFLIQQEVPLRIVTDLIFCGVGVWLAVVGVPADAERPTVATVSGAFVSTFGLTLATPSGIPYIAGLFVAFNRSVLK